MNLNTNTGTQNSGTQNSRTQNPKTPSEISKMQQAIMSRTLQPSLCIQRDDNTVVPLIAMDELPESVVLKGIPIKLTVLEALKAHMELIPGDHRASGIRYQLAQPISNQTVAGEQSDYSGSDSSPSSTNSGNSTQKGFTTSDKKGNKTTVPVRTCPFFSCLALPFFTHILTCI